MKEYEVTFNPQYNEKGSVSINDKDKVYVVIARPTRFCNADCSYCSSPPVEDDDGNLPKWDYDDFKVYFDKIYPYLGSGATWIWHGGEPMLMGIDFYVKTYNYAMDKCKADNKKIRFSMQSNLLAYNDKWYDVFAKIFNGSLSTSFDPDELNRTIKGSSEKYTKVFKRSLDKILDAGFRPMTIGVYQEENAHLMHKMYDYSLSKGEKGFPLRFNYCHPSGRFENTGEAISPYTYGEKLIEIYNRWIKDVTDFTVTPLDQMLKKVININEISRCPWTKKCGGRFVNIEPNGDVFNCTEFADLGSKYKYGNLKENTFQEIITSNTIKQIKKRSYRVPVDCQSCEHFQECEGGCMRDAELYNKGLYGKFHYCVSWKLVFTRIKESILKGEADKVLERYGLNPEEVKKIVRYKVLSHKNMRKEKLNELLVKGNNGFGFYEKEDVKPILNSKKIIKLKIINN